VAQEHTRNYTSTSRQQIIRVDTAQGVVYRGLTIGLLGVNHYAEGMTATSNLNINYVKPLVADKVIVRTEQTEVIGKRIFGIARVMNEKEEVCAYATGSLAKGIAV
jgi:hypothetical protein